MKQRADEPTETRSSTRLQCAILTLFGIELIVALGLVLKTILPLLGFGRYDVPYIAFLLSFLGMLTTIYLAIRPPNELAARVGLVAQWLRKRWWLATLICYLMVEGWYAALRWLGPHIDPLPTRQLIMTALLFVTLWAIAILLFAGHNPEGRRTMQINLLLALIATGFGFWVVSFILVEVLNYKDSGDLVHNWGHMLRYDLQFGYRLERNLGDYQPIGCPSEAGQVYYRNNYEGFRNTGSTAKAPIAIVGDSFVFGHCLNDDEILSSALNKQLGSEVDSYAANGVSLWFYNKYLDVMVRENEPTLVIYSIFVNDLINEPRSLDFSFYQRTVTNGILYYMSPVNFTISQFLTRSPTQQIIQAVGSHDSAQEVGTPNLSTSPSGMVFARDGGVGYTQYLGPDSPNITSRLNEAKELTNELNVELMVVTIPSKSSVYREDYFELFPDGPYDPEREERVYDEICAWLREHDTLCLNLTSALRQSAQDNMPPLYFSTDGHWNAQGVEVAAEAMASFIRSEFGEEYDWLE